MTRTEAVRQIEETGVVAVIRLRAPDKLRAVIDALAEGGVRALEVTMSVPNAPELIREIAPGLSPEFLLGAGTVLDPETARQVILAGAQFVVGPTYNPETLRLCHRYDIAAVPGCFTPTEILTAWEAGADIVKVFPADCVGPAFFKALRGPLPQVRLMPTGGVDLKTAADFLKAGACCLGVGGQLVEPKAVAEGNFDRIRDLARQYVAVVKQVKNSTAAGV